MGKKKMNTKDYGLSKGQNLYFLHPDKAQQDSRIFCKVVSHGTQQVSVDLTDYAEPWATGLSLSWASTIVWCREKLYEKHGSISGGTKLWSKHPEGASLEEEGRKNAKKVEQTAPRQS